MKKLSTNNFTTKLGFIEKQFDWSKRYYCIVDILNSDFENLIFKLILDSLTDSVFPSLTSFPSNKTELNGWFLTAWFWNEFSSLILKLHSGQFKKENAFILSTFHGFSVDIFPSEKKRIKESRFSFFSNPNELKNSLLISEIRNLFKKEQIETRESGSIYSDVSLLSSGKIECLIF